MGIRIMHLLVMQKYAPVAAGACGRILQPRMSPLDIRRSFVLILKRPTGSQQRLQPLMRRSFLISRRSAREIQEPER